MPHREVYMFSCFLSVPFEASFIVDSLRLLAEDRRTLEGRGERKYLGWGMEKCVDYNNQD